MNLLANIKDTVDSIIVYNSKINLLKDKYKKLGIYGDTIKFIISASLKGQNNFYFNTKTCTAEIAKNLSMCKGIKVEDIKNDKNEIIAYLVSWDFGEV